MAIPVKERKSSIEALNLEYDISMYKRKPVYAFIKRTFDIVLSFIAIVLTLWLFLLLIILVKATSKGPAFYAHERVGRNGKVFKVYKFRSMRVDNRPIDEILTKEQIEEYERDYKITNDPRVTKLGKFLRKTSLDELPQLYSVLKGTMSIIGWRPILPEEFERYGKNKELLSKIRPGLTGYWASHGRSLTSYDERIRYELYYVVKRSIWFDIRIIFWTVVGVLKHEGAE